MSPEEVRARRLAGQLLTPPARREPAAVVRALGAMQSQDLPAALWAVGIRAGATAREVIGAMTTGSVLRTHVLRPTWHLVACEDLRPYVLVTGEAVAKAAGPVLRRTGLDAAVLQQVHEVVAETLRTGPATRTELAARLTIAGVDMTDGVRLANALLHAESAGLICSGPPAGTRQTYALVEHRTPAAPPASRAATLADLARRYFTTRGPATPADFRWWAGLRAADARAAVYAVRDEFAVEADAGRELIWPAGVVAAGGHRVALLPNFDEYVVAYADRSELLEERHRPLLDSRANPIFQHVVIEHGAIVGTWSVALRRRRLELTARLFASSPSTALQDGLEAAVGRYAAHREEEVVLAPAPG